MSIRGSTAIVGIGDAPTDRLGGKPGEPKKSTAEYLAWAARLPTNAGFGRGAFGAAVFMLLSL